MANSESSEPTNNESAIVLIDNNMIQHFLSKEVGSELVGLLNTLVEANVTIAVSDIVVYEALKAIVFDQAKFDKVDKFFEQYLTRFPVDSDLLIDAARVHELYGSDPNARNFRATISSEDIIIATTAIVRGARIITCDASDYPMPFFKEISRQYVDYESKGRRKHIVVYLFEPDTDAIQRAFDALTPTPPKSKS